MITYFVFIHKTKSSTNFYIERVATTSRFCQSFPYCKRACARM